MSRPTTQRNQNHYQDYENLSQSEVGWSSDYYSADSPKRNTKAQAKLLLHTPVRVMKKAVSSPLLSSSEQRARTESLFRFDKDLESVAETTSENGKSQSQFDMSSEMYKFDLDDEEILAAVEEIEKENETQRLTQLKNDVQTKYFDDSFDDVILSSIPMEVLTGTNSDKISHVELVFDPTCGLSQIVKSDKKNLPRFTSDPVKSPQKTPKSKAAAPRFGRHNSLPSPSSTTGEFK
jgi:hypothetical protein